MDSPLQSATTIYEPQEVVFLPDAKLPVENVEPEKPIKKKRSKLKILLIILASFTSILFICFLAFAIPVYLSIHKTTILIEKRKQMEFIRDQLTVLKTKQIVSPEVFIDKTCNNYPNGEKYNSLYIADKAKCLNGIEIDFESKYKIKEVEKCQNIKNDINTIYFSISKDQSALLVCDSNGGPYATLKY